LWLIASYIYILGDTYGDRTTAIGGMTIDYFALGW
jgi:hypothetical protein